MDDRLRQQLEQLLQESATEERVVTLIKRALEVDIPFEDRWLREVFKSAATLLKQVNGKEANQVLPWLLFSLGVAYERGRIDELRQV